MVNYFKQNRWLRIALVVLGELVLLLLVFRAGMVLGFERAQFSYQWGAHYGQLFGEPRHGFFQEFGDDTNSGGVPSQPTYGASGTVLSVSGNVIAITGSDNVEKTIMIDATTVIRRQMQTITAGDIRVGESIVAIGAPNGQGQIVAKFIRVFPPQGPGALPQNGTSSKVQ